MIPVSLRLTNFMSYGAEAPVLDFEQFHVACLSGRNGQGKSALLDAITWALWGEARKSSGSHKPDEELVRIGERAMQVEFVFDSEGERYRVVRAYRRSASGKTSKPELELHVLEAGGGEFKPLTGVSMRETQEHIDAAVGLDYDTFINSAFVLQGRSDEFTKKRPSERKEILARILDLGRYELLCEMAAVRERDARKDVEQADLDIQRLGEVLEGEPAWKAGLAEVEQAIASERTRLEGLRAQAQCLAERLVVLEARTREAAALRQALDTLRQRLAQHRKDAQDLQDRIAQAETLIAQRDVIRQDHERYRALQKERDELDTRNDLFRGVEKQVERAEAELKDLRHSSERQLEKLELEQKNDRKWRDDCVLQLAEEASVLRRVEAARAAGRRFEEMGVAARQRDELDVQIRQAEGVLLGKREALNGQRQTLEAQIRREQAGLSESDELKAEVEALEKEAVRLTTLKQELAEVEEQGKEISGDLHRQSATVSARTEEIAKLAEQLERLDDSLGGRCPTCGTILRPEHREEVRADFREQILALRKDETFLQSQLDRRKADRDALRGSYVRLREQIGALDGVSERLAAKQERLRRQEERRVALGKQEQELEVVRRTLADETYGEEERLRLRDLQARREALSFDEKAYERLRDEAAQRTHFEDRLQRLEEVKGRKEQLEKSMARRQQELDTLRRQLDEGIALKPLQDKIRRLGEQLEGIGFEPHRFRAVKQALEALRDAGTRMTDLVNAQQNHADWKERLADVQERTQAEEEEGNRQEAGLAAMQAELQEKATVEARRREQTDACRASEAALNNLQIQLGQLSEKLEKAGRDREQLRQQRNTQQEARARQRLYKHLRAAFGKHGIPSLIIEQTLPEIEDRTNDLMERLTDGAMHIRLETLKDKKTGGTMETLEIKITDEQGVSRPYETFSGGEAFRVNFALRIALAQLLAERSGVRIRTLVVDEGFGTQDQQGVQNLVEAIQTIQDDFDKILVITHLPELKEAFPIRIEVEKHPVDGSRFEIIGV